MDLNRSVECPSPIFGTEFPKSPKKPYKVQFDSHDNPNFDSNMDSQSISDDTEGTILGREIKKKVTTRSVSSEKIEPEDMEVSKQFSQSTQRLFKQSTKNLVSDRARKFNSRQSTKKLQLAQIFHVSFEDKEKIREQWNNLKKEQMRAKYSVGLAKDPQELIEGIADLLTEIGFDHSFIDFEELERRGMRTEGWEILTNGLLKSTTSQGALFQSNLQQLIEEQNRIKSMSIKKKKKNRMNDFSQNGDSQIDGEMTELGSQYHKGSVTNKSAVVSESGTHRRNNRVFQDFGNKFITKIACQGHDTVDSDYPEGYRGHWTQHQIHAHRSQYYKEIKVIYHNHQDRLERMMAQYDRITSLQQIHHHLQESVEQNAFQKEVQKITKRKNVFNFTQKLPGISPVAELISRKNIEITPKKYEAKIHLEPWKCGLFLRTPQNEDTNSSSTFFCYRNKSQANFRTNENMVTEESEEISKLKNIRNLRQKHYEKQVRPGVYKLVQKNLEQKRNTDPIKIVYNNLSAKISNRGGPDSLYYHSKNDLMMHDESTNGPLSAERALFNTQGNAKYLRKLKQKMCQEQYSQSHSVSKLSDILKRPNNVYYDYCKNFKSGNLAK